MASKKQSAVQTLPSELRSIVRSGIAITSVAQCVEELVYNSIDSEAKNIHITVNIEEFNVKVEDDGVGLTEADLTAVGQRHSTSKCHGLEDLNNLKYYGFRGEALASIIDTSESVDITTRHKGTSELELKKRFKNGKALGFVERVNSTLKTSGTTVSAVNLLSKLPVRQKRIDKALQLDEVRHSLGKIVLINPSLNVTLMNGATGKQIFGYKSASSCSESFDQLHQQKLGFQAEFVQEHYLYKNLFLELYLSSEFCKKSYQYVFVNGRYIQKCKIHKWLGQNILDLQKSAASSSPKKDKYPIFILKITCPLSEYDITLDPKKQTVEFKNWSDIQTGIEGLVTKYKSRNSLLAGSKANKFDGTLERKVKAMSSFDVKTALHSKFATRKEVTVSEPDVASSKASIASGSSFTSEGKTKTLVTNSRRSLTRTGVNSYVVDVKSLRRKRKLQQTGNAALGKDWIHVNSNPRKGIVDFRPQKTLKIFKSFPEWKNEFNRRPSPKAIPPKRPRMSDSLNDREHSHNETTRTAERELPMPPSTTKSTYNWKMQHFLENCGNDQSGPVDMCIDSGVDSPPRPSVAQMPDRNVNAPQCPPPPSMEKSKLVNLELQLKSVQEKTPTQPSPPHADQADPHPPASLPCPDRRKEMEANMERIGLEYMENIIKNCWKSKNFKQDIHKTIISDEETMGECEICVKDTSKWKSLLVEETPRKNIENLPSVGDDHLSSKSQRSSCNSVIIKAPFLKLPSMLPLVDDKSKSFNVTANETRNDEPPPEEPSSSKSTRVLAPPLLNLLPCQKIPASEWSDKMLDDDFEEEDNDLFPTDFKINIVSDTEGVEWLQTTDSSGRLIYVNLSNGESSQHVDQLFGSLKTVNVGEMKKMNPVKYSLLRNHLPRSFTKFWDGSRKKELSKTGDFSKIQNSLIKDSVLKGVQSRQLDQDSLISSKWKKREDNQEEESLATLSQYFCANSDPTDGVLPGKSNSNGMLPSSRWKGAPSSLRLTKEDLNNTSVIGQYDCKFILCTVQKSLTYSTPTLVVFDQHAVHERIRLEKFISDSIRVSQSTGKKYLVHLDLFPAISLQLSESEVTIVRTYGDFFLRNALRIEHVRGTYIKVKSVPKCFHEKVSSEPPSSRQSLMETMIRKLIQELTQHIVDTRGVTLTGVPRTVHDILASQACHGAIKFGDELDLAACQKLVTDLKSCKNPFICAHGRPSIAPLLTAIDLTTSRLLDQKIEHPLITSARIQCDESHSSCSNYFCDTRELKGSDLKEEDVHSGYFQVRVDREGFDNPETKVTDPDPDPAVVAKAQVEIKSTKKSKNANNRLSQSSVEIIELTESDFDTRPDSWSDKGNQGVVTEVQDEDENNNDSMEVDEGDEESPYFVRLKM